MPEHKRKGFAWPAEILAAPVTMNEGGELYGGREGSMNSWRERHELGEMGDNLTIYLISAPIIVCVNGTFH